MRLLWGVVGVVLLVLAGCASERVAGRPDRTEAPPGPYDLAVPIEIARVSPTVTETTTSLPDPDGATLHVEEPFLTITRLDHAEVSMRQTTWGLLIRMTEEDGAVFSEWTETHTGERVAMIVDGEVASAPWIQSPIPGREILVSARYTQTEAWALLHRITGR